MIKLVYLKKYKILKCIYEIDGIYNYKICRIIGSTSDYVSKIIELFVEKGLISKRRIGRRNSLSITEKGREVFKKLNKIKEIWK